MTPSGTGEPSSSGAPSSSGTAVQPLDWRRNAWLFLATVASVFYTSAANEKGFPDRASILAGLTFTVCLLGILLAHEFGHYIAARIHKVDASLPYFIPMPMLSPFGTMGAVIRMRGTIPTRKALLDIGAAGPLAGLCVAIPLYAYGAAHSQLVPVDVTAGGMDLGESLLTRLLDHFFAPVIPDGMTLTASPVLFAAWGGMFVTMINLFPVGQLDGGHVAYALFGKKQDRAAVFAHRAMLAFFLLSVAGYLFHDVRAGIGLYRIGKHVNNSLFWLVWFEVLGILGSLASQGRDGASSISRNKDSEAAPAETLTIGTRIAATVPLVFLAALARDQVSPAIWLAWFGGLGLLIAMEVRGGTLRPHSLHDHPTTGSQPLGTRRAIVAVLTLVFFALLFMPTPFSM